MTSENKPGIGRRGMLAAAGGVALASLLVAAATSGAAAQVTGPGTAPQG